MGTGSRKLKSDTDHMASAVVRVNINILIGEKKGAFYNSFKASWARMHHQSAACQLANSNLDFYKTDPKK